MEEQKDMGQSVILTKSAEVVRKWWFFQSKRS